MAEKLGRVGVIGRFKPLHNGGALMLETICERAEQVIIGIGSSNKYNARNPFTAQESEAMIRLALEKFSNYSIIHIPDFGQIPDYQDGRRWRAYVIEKYGSLDYFITGNGYVAELLGDFYPLLHPSKLIPEEKWTRLRATEVRLRMASDRSWKELVPEKVAFYLEQNNLVSRFQKEFGLETLALLAQNIQANRTESAAEEKQHAQEVS